MGKRILLCCDKQVQFLVRKPCTAIASLIVCIWHFLFFCIFSCLTFSCNKYNERLCVEFGDKSTDIVYKQWMILDRKCRWPPTGIDIPFLAKNKAQSNSKWKVYQCTILCQSGMSSFIITSCLWCGNSESAGWPPNYFFRFCYDILHVLGTYQRCEAKAYSMKSVPNTSADETCNTLDMSCLDEENICLPTLERTEGVILQATDCSTPKR